MPGITALSKAQLGRESTAGTAVAATTIWRGTHGYEDTSVYKWVDEQVAIIGGTDRQSKTKIEGTANLSQDATFEQILHPLEGGISTVSATVDGTGSGYIREYNYPTTADTAVKTYTIEVGDNMGAEEMAYCYCGGFSLSGNAGDASALSSDWVGRGWAPTTFTGALSLPSISEILTSKSKLYIDAIGGTIGTTQKTGTLLNYALNVNTGLMPYLTQDGDLYFFGIKRAGGEISLDLTFESDAISIAQKAIWRAGTPQLLRLKFEGDALTSAGTLYTYKTLMLDFAGKFESFSGPGDQDGNRTFGAKFVAKYNTTAGFRFKATVVTDLSAIP